ncbi:hypothetical protein MASR2M66_20660 [Chloroflexota bacterium]
MNKKTTKPISSVSIRYAIPGLLAVVIIIAIGLTAWLSYQSGLGSAQTLAERLNQEVSARINDRINSFLELPHIFHEINLAVLNSGDADLNNFDSMRELFWGEVFVTQSVPYLYYGTPKGDFLGIDVIFGGEPAFKIRNEETSPNRVTYSMTAEGQPLEELESKEYDPRERPWYTAAVEAGVPTWSPIYVFSAKPVLGISPVSPVYNRSGQLQGVLGIDLTLSEISDFLRTLEISEHGEAFIIQPDGKLVAASTDEQPFTVVDGKQQLLDVSDSETPLLRLTAEHMLTIYNDFDNIDEARDIKFEKDGETYYAQIDTISDERGLDWISVVVVPSSDFLGPVLQNLRNTAFFGLIVLVLSTMLGFLLASWIIRPIFTVTDVAANIEESVWDLEPLHVVIERTDELGQLARVFAKMAKEIQAREVELKRQVVALKIQIDQKKRASQVSEIVESDFFQGLREKAQAMRNASKKKPDEK